MEIYWDKPQGDLYRFENKEELIFFLNKTQITDHLEDLEEFGIRVKLIEDDIDELSFDGEYAVQLLRPEDKNFYKIAVHALNPYFDDDDQIASTIGNTYGTFILKSEDVELDERWSFPCHVYAWFDKGADRLGGFEIRIFNVWPIGEERTISKNIQFENENAPKQIHKLNEYLKFKKLDFSSKRDNIERN